MIVLDTSVLIGHLEAADRHHEAARNLLLAAVGDDLGVSTITLAEVLVGPVREGRLDDAVAVLRQLEVAELPLPRHAAVGLARLRATTGLELPECCVLVTAEAAGAALASFDGRLVVAARRAGVPVATAA